jgi:hypothetical protein
MTIGANAQQWYKKPVAMGGGGGSFYWNNAKIHYDANYKIMVHNNKWY